MLEVAQTGQCGGNSVAYKRADFTYNRAGQFDTIDRYAGTLNTTLVAHSAYGYDNAGRLTALTHAGIEGHGIEGHDTGIDDMITVRRHEFR